MHWKLKAIIQNVVSLLPASFSYPAYYWIQRRFGGLRHINVIDKLSAGIETFKRVQEHGHTPVGKIFLEVGTGRVPVEPLAYWLMGAEKTISIDLNPYVKAELVTESLAYISAHQDEVIRLFGPLLDRKRFDKLLEFNRNYPFVLSDFLDLCRMKYISPGDAADTGLPGSSIDYHTSTTVLEHIPPAVLKKILEEGNRIIRSGGLFIHYIDYSDHFCHTDPSISSINFLQYGETEWMRYAGNRYMYMNRLRHDDYLALYESIGHRILEARLSRDPRAQEILKNGSLNLNERFSSKPAAVLAITGALMITAKTADGALTGRG